MSKETIKAIEHIMKHGCSRITACSDCPARMGLKNDPSMCRLLRKIPSTCEVVKREYIVSLDADDMTIHTNGPAYRGLKNIPKEDKEKPIRIPHNDYGNFVVSLIRAARKRTGVNAEIGFNWAVGEKDTHCTIHYKDAQYCAHARRHPKDRGNEYIGKSLSFKRAYAALVADVNNITELYQTGTALLAIKKGEFGSVLIEGTPYLCKAGADIEQEEYIEVGSVGCVFPSKKKQNFRCIGMYEVRTPHGPFPTVFKIVNARCDVIHDKSKE